MNKYCPKNDGTCPEWEPACNHDYVSCSHRDDMIIDPKTGDIILDTDEETFYERIR